MESTVKINEQAKEKSYELLLLWLDDMLSSERDWLANLANCSALLYQNLNDINWAGFYLFKDQELVLGPFQGKIACTRIKLGRGVCGTAAQTKKTQVVKNVHEFPGHIACDSASNSEIVVPIIKNEELIGVLDIDSHIFERFDDLDARYLKQIADKLSAGINWPAAR